MKRLWFKYVLFDVEFDKSDQTTESAKPIFSASNYYTFTSEHLRSLHLFNRLKCICLQAALRLTLVKKNRQNRELRIRSGYLSEKVEP